LAWADSSNNEDGFKIERKTGAAGTYAEIATVGANVASYSSTGLSVDTEYFYRVRAHNVGGHSNYSNEANATTFPNAPQAPGGLTALTISQTQIDIAWADSSNNEAGFKIERKIGTTGTFTLLTTVGANVTSYSDLGLTANTKYTYRLRAYNAGGNSAYCTAASATTLPLAPAKPLNLVATTASNTQINLAWTDNSANEVGFKIERKTGAAGAYAEIATVGANVASYSDNGLSPITEYFYRVRAYNTGGNSAYSNESNAATFPNAPAAPDSLTATTVSNTQINLAWADSSNNEDGFKIERKTGAGGTYAEIATVGANVTSYSDNGLSQITEYFYRVRAYNTGGNSAYSNEANATTLPDPPAAPSSLTATTISQTQIDLAWTDNAGNEDGFKIERKTGAAGTYAEIATVGANVASYSDNGLSPIKEYFYRVRAYNTGGNSAYSNESNAATFPNAPAAPDSLTATTVSNTQINLAWADSSNNEDGFKIERKTGAEGTYAEIATVGANVTSYSDNGLSQITEYFYRVRAYNTGGNSAYSNEANATTLPDPPTKPGNLVATSVSNKQINLAWADSSNNEDGFKIERKTGAGGTYAEIATVGADVTSLADTSLSQNTEYFYRVRAYNAGGNSAYSNEANATTLPDPPTAPSSLTATVVSNKQINLAWADNANNEAGFKIERKTGAAGTYAEVMTVGANVTSLADSSLIANTEYFYRVRAYNAGGNSDYSNEASAVTLSDVNLALGKTATASSTDTNTPDLAVDGNVATYWRSGFVNSAAPIAWLQVELNASTPVTVGRAVVTWFQNYFAIEYEFQVSTDGANWTVVYTNNAGGIGAQDFTFTQTTAKYVRLYMKKNEKSNYRVAELEVYAGGVSKAANGGTNAAAAIPEEFFLAQNYPNPFNPSTTIRFGLKEAGVVHLSIYNLQGQEVRALISGQMNPGEHSVIWNGRDNRGRLLSNGMYIYKLRVNGFEQIKKMSLVK
jgi:transcriptional regulator CtsR